MCGRNIEKGIFLWYFHATELYVLFLFPLPHCLTGAPSLPLPFLFLNSLPHSVFWLCCVILWISRVHLVDLNG